MFNHKLPTDFPMQTLRKKTSPLKYKNEPGRFLGEGVSFRAKLIGVLEVPEARGDRMCQEALADLKMAIRAAGEHKQRIQVHVAIDGLRLRDDKTGDSLYHHPVHKISFIAQDMTDSRAFGYIFGSPDTGHRFFGIKTDKAASQVVIAMRDLFQVVFELKKKEIELAKQQLEGKGSGNSLLRTATSIANEIKAKSMFGANESTSSAPKAAVEEGGVADLVDLEQELSSLRRGLSQVEGLTPATDPFGDSFIATHHQSVALPPPPSRVRPSAMSPPAVSVTSALPQVTSSVSQVTSSVNQVTSSVSQVTSAVPHIPPSTASVSISSVSAAVSLDPLADPLESPVESRNTATGYDVFTELDPLGTGRSKPYVDRKLFFQELKNPPKKVLKDLVPTTNTTVLLSDILSEKTDRTATSLSRQSAGTASGASRTLYADPFADTDPFDSTDPFEDSFKDDPFINAPEKPNSKEDQYRYKVKPTFKEEKHTDLGTKSVFNGSLQVTLPPEPMPKSPRLNRQKLSESSTVRARPAASGSAGRSSGTSVRSSGGAVRSSSGAVRSSGDAVRSSGDAVRSSGSVGRSPPPLPPKNPPTPDPTPPLPPPLRRTDRYSLVSRAVVSQSSEDEYVTPDPPPLPGARHLDLSLTHLLTTDIELLAHRLRVPVATLSSMTLPQLTAYLRSYLAADIDRSRIHVEPTDSPRELPKPTLTAPIKTTSFAIEKMEKPVRDEFEDNFTPPTTANGTFVANFDDFDKKVNPSYDRYAVFREIQEEELKTKSVLTTDDQSYNEDNKSNTDDREEFTSLGDYNLIPQDKNNKELSHSPLKSLDELTLDSFNMFRNTVSPKPIDSKIEDIKNVMKNLQLDNCRRSVSPRDNCKRDDANDRYAALRDITVTEPQDEFESLPPDVPKERKRSDEKSDGFDNSDFFDCIDNSSLSFSHVEDAFRKSPSVREKLEERELVVEKKSVEIKSPALSQRKLQPVISVGSLSDVASGSSPETKDVAMCRVEGGGVGGRWGVWSGGRGSPSPSSDSDPPHTPPHSHRGDPHRGGHYTHRQTSSSSRDMSWDEEPPTRKSTHSRHNSSGSRECLDSGSGRDKDKKHEKRISRERERDHRDDRESLGTRERDRKDSGSGRDRDRERRDSNERNHRRDRRSRERDKDMWERERDYSKEREYRDSRSRDKTNEYRDKERNRDRHRKQPPSWDEDDEDYSEGCGSGRSSPRDRRAEQRWRRDDRNYGSLGWRERRRSDRKEDDSADRGDRRYGATLSWSSRRSTSSVGSSGRRDDRRRPRRDERHRRRDRDYENHYVDTPPHNKRTNYSNLEGTRFAFEPETTTASPMSGSSNRARDGDSPVTRFRFDSDSVSPRSMFEDDFTVMSTSRGRAASIAEEDEDVPPLRNKPLTQTKDIKKSDSVNIFVRENDPFENDDFFACTGSDRAARRENWPGDFNAFEHS